MTAAQAALAGPEQPHGRGRHGIEQTAINPYGGLAAAAGAVEVVGQPRSGESAGVVVGGQYEQVALRQGGVQQDHRDGG